MKVFIICCMTVLLVTNCAKQNIKGRDIYKSSRNNFFFEKSCFIEQHISSELYESYILACSCNYGVDPFLVKAIIQVESNYNPEVVSKSNAIGLMQLKADTAGRDAYRLKGKIGKPSICELKNAAINIDLGTAYLSILQNQLEGIVNPETRRYAVIVSYVNGLNALLQIFDNDRNCAIKKINKFTAKQFYQYIQHYHPSKQAQRYLFKVNTIYSLQNNNFE